jgi:hypothetical protein
MKYVSLTFIMAPLLSSAEHSAFAENSLWSQLMGKPRKNMSINGAVLNTSVVFIIIFTAFDTIGNMGARSTLTANKTPWNRKNILNWFPKFTEKLDGYLTITIRFGHVIFSSPVSPFDLSGRKMKVFLKSYVTVSSSSLSTRLYFFFHSLMEDRKPLVRSDQSPYGREIMAFCTHSNM